ncbi:V-set and immunoglobulin domain-containing protein 1-like [Pholidichthys leucotaenia]
MMAVGTSLCFTLLLLFLPLPAFKGEALPQQSPLTARDSCITTFTFSPSVQIVLDNVEPGEDVILKCSDNAAVTAVKWINTYLQPETVFEYQDGRLVLECQHPLYMNRVELQDRDMTDGSVSVILKNVTTEDSGRYECHVVQGKTKPSSIIHLSVVQRDTISAEPGQDVTLPCRTPKYIKKPMAVDWTRPDLLPRYVLSNQYRIFELGLQHPSFRKRVKQMEDGDATLILKNATFNDSGTYMCSFIVDDVGILFDPTHTISILQLNVTLSGGTDRGNKDGGTSISLIVGLSLLGMFLLVCCGVIVYRC